MLKGEIKERKKLIRKEGKNKDKARKVKRIKNCA